MAKFFYGVWATIWCAVFIVLLFYGLAQLGQHADPWPLAVAFLAAYFAWRCGQGMDRVDNEREAEARRAYMRDRLLEDEFRRAREHSSCIVGRTPTPARRRRH